MGGNKKEIKINVAGMVIYYMMIRKETFSLFQPFSLIRLLFNLPVRRDLSNLLNAGVCK